MLAAALVIFVLAISSSAPPASRVRVYTTEVFTAFAALYDFDACHRPVRCHCSRSCRDCRRGACVRRRALVSGAARLGRTRRSARLLETARAAAARLSSSRPL